MTNGAKEKAETIIAAIRQVFGSVTRGNGISLHEADAIDDYADDNLRDLARALDTDQHWWEITPGQLEQFPWAWCFMDAEGFRYYLPAYMTQALKNYEVGSDAMEIVLAALDPVVDADKYALLDDAQKKIVAQFLWFVSTEKSDRLRNDREVDDATTALEKFWYPYLS